MSISKVLDVLRKTKKKKYFLSLSRFLSFLTNDLRKENMKIPLKRSDALHISSIPFEVSPDDCFYINKKYIRKRERARERKKTNNVMRSSAPV